MARQYPRGRTAMRACFLAAVLVSSAPAEAGWLDRARGVGAGAQLYAQVSAYRSIKQNLGALTGLFSDMLDAAVKGDSKRTGEVWSDIRDLPGMIVRDAFPVLSLVDSVSATLKGTRERLGATRARVERLIGKAGATTSIASLAISREERPFYEWTVGILGDEPLPVVAYAETAVIEERLRKASGNDDREADIWREGSAGSKIKTGASKPRQSYDVVLKGLDEILASSSGVIKGDRKPESSGYESRLEALDRRRAEYEANFRERTAATAAKQKQRTADVVRRDGAARMQQATVESENTKPKRESKTGGWRYELIQIADLRIVEHKGKKHYVTHKHLPESYYGKFEQKGGQFEWYFILRSDGTGETATQIYSYSKDGHTYEGAKIKSFDWGVLVKDKKFSRTKYTRWWYGKKKEFEAMTMVAWNKDSDGETTLLVRPLHEAVLKDGSRVVILGKSHKVF
ncbi:MAG: hypothetical protein OYH76_22735 [Defluviicoccus sp.]|nr:hypothetical protein [Defluviicoccus sp.]MDE0278722.1 hypothetical protein [Defluviicoccus sp.]